MIPYDILFGGITGLFGTVITSFTKYKTQKQDHTHEEKMVELDLKAMIKEAEMKIKVTSARIEGEVELADAAAFDTSQRVGNKQLFAEKWIDMIMANRDKKWTGWIFGFLGTMIASGFALVDWLNGIMRPALTIYLVSGSTYITYLAWLIMQACGLETLSSEQAVAIFTQVTSTMIYLSVSTVTWWFGDRTMSKFLQDRNSKNIV